MTSGISLGKSLSCKYFIMMASLYIQGLHGCCERHSTHYQPLNFDFTFASFYCVANHLKWVQSSELSRESNDACDNHFAEWCNDIKKRHSPLY